MNNKKVGKNALKGKVRSTGTCNKRHLRTKSNHEVPLKNNVNLINCNNDLRGDNATKVKKPQPKLASLASKAQKKVRNHNKENICDFLNIGDEENKPYRNTRLRNAKGERKEKSSLKLEKDSTIVNNCKQIPIWKKELSTELTEYTNSSKYDVYDISHDEDIMTDDTIFSKKKISRQTRNRRVTAKSKVLRKKRYSTKIREYYSKYKDPSESTNKMPDSSLFNVTEKCSKAIQFNGNTNAAIKDTNWIPAEPPINEDDDTEDMVDVPEHNSFPEPFNEERIFAIPKMTSTPTCDIPKHKWNILNNLKNKKQMNDGKSITNICRQSIKNDKEIEGERIKTRSQRQVSKMQVLKEKTFDIDCNTSFLTPKTILTPVNTLNISQRRSSRLQEKAKILDKSKMPDFQKCSFDDDCFIGYNQNVNMNNAKDLHQNDVIKLMDHTFTTSAGIVNTDDIIANQNVDVTPAEKSHEISSGEVLGASNKSSKILNFYAEFEQSFITDGIDLNFHTKKGKHQHHSVPENTHSDEINVRLDLPILGVIDEENVPGDDISLSESPVKENLENVLGVEQETEDNHNTYATEVEETVKNPAASCIPENVISRISRTKKNSFSCEKQKATRINNLNSKSPDEGQIEFENNAHNSNEGDNIECDEINHSESPTKETQTEHISSVHHSKAVHFGKVELFEDIQPFMTDVQEAVNKPSRTYSSKYFKTYTSKKVKPNVPKKKKIINKKVDRLAEKLNKHFEEIDDTDLYIE